MKIKKQIVKKEILKTLDLEKEENLNINSEDEDDDVSLDSDQELQLAFARNELKPGLNIPLEKPREFVNDQAGLERKLKDFYLKEDWIERLDLVVPSEINKKSLEKDEQELVDNDFTRESFFLKQAQAAVKLAMPRLKGFNVAAKRPEDYFAQMAKSDDHMKKVREALLTRNAELEKRDKVRKLRELKKMGKQIQIEAEKMKQKGKRVYKSEKQFLDAENESPTAKKSKQDGKNRKPSKKTKYKNEKFGFGGRKKRSKYNTAESYAEAYKNPTNKMKRGVKKTPSKFVNKNKPKKNSMRK